MHIEDVTTNSLTIVDSKGMPRIVLSVDECDGDSDCQIELKDANGQLRYNGEVIAEMRDQDGRFRDLIGARGNPLTEYEEFSVRMLVHEQLEKILEHALTRVPGKDRDPNQIGKATVEAFTGAIHTEAVAKTKPLGRIRE